MANLKDLIVNGSARILGTIYGNVAGNVTGNVSGSSGSCTGNAATATKATQDASGNNIVNTYATKTEVGGKQATLVSGTNIKTINNNSILGSGNLTLDGLPSQSGNTGKYLTTNGSTASWTEVNVSSYHPNIFDIKWSDHLVNDVQWLRGDTFSWQDGDVYSTAYNKLVEEYSTGTEETEGDITFKRTTNGFKIATANQENAILAKYNNEGIAWYYILDTDNTRFKLPRTKFGFEGLRGNVGDDISESLPNIKGSIEDNSMLDTGANAIVSGALKVGVSSTRTWAQGYTSKNTSQKIEFDASHSSSTYQDNAPVQERATQMYLYFYVGEYTQTAIEQTAGLNAELFNNKVDISTYNSDKKYTTQNITGTSATVPAVYLKECYIAPDTPTNGYNIWSNGYCEQWGQTSGRDVTVTFLKNFADTNYNVVGNELMTSPQCEYDLSIVKTSTNQIRIYCDNGGGSFGGYGASWRACGYLAEGQY